VERQTKYAKSGDVSIAYQVVGDGPLDLVHIPEAWTPIEWLWEEPTYARFLGRLASFSRVILFDKRGTGLSDRVPAATLEERMDDVRAVMDAAGSTRAALFGVCEGGPMSLLFAATYPERTSALVLYGTYARFSWDAEYPWGFSTEALDWFRKTIENSWGSGGSLAVFAPSVVDDPRFREWWGRCERLGASPGAVCALMRMDAELDVRDILPTVRVPTLMIHRTGDRLTPVSGARYTAARLPCARFVELPGDDHLFFVGDHDVILEEIEEFLTGVRPTPEPDRVLATVLFTDIVGSTERAVELGDRRWQELLESYYALVRHELARFRGREINTAGDGFFATFDGPARAIRCARAISDAVKRLGISVRAGLHTGECEVVDGKVGGIAVHIGARVAATAGAGDVLVSSTVKDLVAGSGIRFADRGVHALKGVPGQWHLFAADAKA
jgi:class 3 adenylate cyclase